MRFLRENLFFVVLVAVTLVGATVGLGYYLTSDVSEKLASRTKVSRALTKLSKNRRKVNATIVSDLRERIDVIRNSATKDAQDAVNFNRSNLQTVQLPVGATRMRPAFPIDPVEYNNRGLYLVFIKQYGKALNDMLAWDPLKRVVLPTRDEIKQEEGRLKERFKDQAYRQAVLSMRVKKARSGMVYIGDDALDRYFTNETRASDTQLWEAQVNLWITREILQAIATTNRQLATERLKAGVGSPDADVLSAAVKRLVKINITESLSPRGVGSGRSGASGKLSRRTTTGEYMVVPYTFTVIMPPRHVTKLLRNLMLQNYHAVLNVGMVEAFYQRNSLYYHGTEPVVTVEVTGEMLLLTEWTRPLMPKVLQDKLPKGRARPK